MKIQKIIDISMEISEEMIVYKNREENKPRIEVSRSFVESDVFETTLHMVMHTGTHLDRPLHVIRDGKTLDSFPLNSMVRPAVVLDLTHVEGGIMREHLLGKEVAIADSYVLLKTRNSFKESFDFDFVYLEASGAEYLKEQRVIGVGIDALGIERDQPDKDTHNILLKNDIVIIEGLRLKEAEEGEYTLIAAPLKIKGAEASPIRALLIR